jgi:DNA repair exonuclease SbcCD nuclease subunit
MIRLLWRTDIHMSDHTPVSRKDVWSDAILSKLAQVGDICRHRSVDAVLDGGDFFNDKSPTRVSHQLVSRVTQVHSAYPCPVYANVGNHDVPHAKLSKLHESPLETLFTAGVFRRLYDEHEVLLEKNGLRVRVVGIPYHGSKYELDRFDIRKKDEDFLVVAAHVLASPTKTTMFEREDIVPYSFLEKIDSVDVWCFGHWHKDQGVTRLGNGSHVVNVGSMTRGSLVEDELDRIPKVVLLEFDRGISIVQIPLQVGSGDQVFDLQRRIVEETDDVMLSIFARTLTASLGVVDNGVSLEDQVTNVVSQGEVRDLVLSFISRARHDMR